MSARTSARAAGVAGVAHPLQPGTGWLVENEQATPEYVARLETSFQEHPGAGMFPLPGVVSEYDAARVSVVKIDVEGAEMAVMGAGEFLWSGSSPPCAVIEYEERYGGAREEIFEFFARRGWGLYIISRNERGLPTYNRLSESYVASQFENVFAIPPGRFAYCTRDCDVFAYDHAAMRREFGGEG